MPRARDPMRVLRRIDVRLGLGLAAAIGLLLVVQMSLFFFIATHETAEILQAVVRNELRAAAAHLERGTDWAPKPDSKHRSSVALRLTDATGRPVQLQGTWPLVGRAWDARTPSLRLAFASAEDHLLERRPIASGASLEGALSLAEFAEERSELLGQILWSLGLCGILLFGLAAAATRLALSPLRAATRALERIDEHHLDSRIAERGSADDVDRHARALNHVLQRLEDAFQRMAAFTADVAHELRTPVNRMLNSADLALLRDRSQEAPAELLAVRQAAEVMRRLIDDLLLLARGDEGRLVVAGEPVHLAEAISELVELYRPTCEERRIELSFRTAEKDLVALGDRQLLGRAVSNLLDNAVRHTPRQGCVEVALELHEPWIEIAVSDSGPGIAERDRERIFERFVQLDESRASDGSGLGLALVRMIARFQGGEVRAEAAILGGARFRIRLPLRPAPARASLATAGWSAALTSAR